MKQIRVLIKGLVALGVTLLISSFAIFAAVHVAPGDAAELLAGRNPDPETLALIRAEYHLDQPFLVQYWLWLVGAVQGDLGRSTAFRTDVVSLILDRGLTTVMLVGYASVLISVLGVGLGIIAALRGRWAATWINTGTTIAMGAPAFAVAVLLIWLFSTQLDWFPIYGTGTGFFDRLWHLTLPAVSLSLMYVAYVARVTQSAIRSELHSEHVAVARSRGIPSSLVVRRHVLRNAAPPVITLVGLTVAGLVAGTAVAEQAFGVSGIGSLLVTAASQQDIPVVLGVSMIVVTVFVVVNTIVDVIVAGIDPRTEGSLS